MQATPWGAYTISNGLPANHKHPCVSVKASTLYAKHSTDESQVFPNIPYDKCKVRYVKLQALSAIKGDKLATIAELEIIAEK